MINDEDFLDGINENEEDNSSTNDLETSEFAEKEDQIQAQKNQLARKRIDELMEKKRLKELLDDEDDW